MAFYAATRSSLLLKTRKFVLSLNEAVLDLQQQKKLYQAKQQCKNNLQNSKGGR